MSTDDILFETRGALGLITLNRPEALNALTHEMVRRLDAQLQAWEADPAVRAIAIQGAGDKAFCAGGDIRALYDNGTERAVESFAFFIDEYRLNARIKRLKTPYLALMDGAVMGGGVGVSIHGRYRIGGDRLKFAMPEVGIGFIPDVGGSYFLPRLPRRIGWWLGLSGARLGPGDAVFAHIIDYYVRSDQFEPLIARLAAAAYGSSPEEADETICEILAETAAPPPAAELRERAGEIEAAFEADTLADALSALGAGSDWARAQGQIISEKSPTALALTWRMLGEGARLRLEDALKIEYRLARNRVVSAEFREGVRAAVIDKDQAPAWDPADLGAIATADLDAAFRDLGVEELRFD